MSALRHSESAFVFNKKPGMIYKKTDILLTKNVGKWWALRDSNPGPPGYEPDALTS